MPEDKPAWEKVGEIGVDSGLVWIGDPCYMIPSEGKRRLVAESWEQFVTLASVPHGFGGLGICTQTPNGDGIYPVEVKRTPEGKIAELRVRFV